MKITFTSHKQEALDASEKAIDRALMTAGMMAESEAKRTLTANKSVQTGLLRNSITFARGGKPANAQSYTADDGSGSGSYEGKAPADPKDNHAVYIGTNVYYAPFVELGTSRGNTAKPYLRPSASAVGKKLKEIVQRELQKG